MKKLLFSGTGFPGSIKTLQVIQENILNVVQNIALSHENYTVLYGMNVVGSTISSGAFVYNGEIISFTQSPTGTKITINEVVEMGDFNTNPSNKTSLESLPAYSSKSAQTGTGGIHTFDFTQLKRYTNQIVLEKGVTVANEAIPFEGTFIGSVSIPHRELTDDELNNSMIIYTITWANNVTSHIGGLKHGLLYRSKTNFHISLEMNLSLTEKPKIIWQIVKM